MSEQVVQGEREEQSSPVQPNKFRPGRVMLTDSRIRGLKPAEAGKRYSLWDAQQPGLAIRVTDSGAKSFVVARRRPGHKAPTFVVLGRYPQMSLKDARDRAPEVLSQLSRGESPREAEHKKRADTVGAVVEEFIKRHVSSLRTAAAAEVRLRHKVLGQRRAQSGAWVPDPGARGHWRDRPIVEIARRDVVELVERVRDRDGRHAARKLLNDVKKLFKWAINRNIYSLPDVSPCALVEPKELLGKFQSRYRVLSDDEIRLVWRASVRLGYPYGSMVRLLLLTGQRRGEISDAQWSEIDLSTKLLTIAAERMKGGEAHTVPLTTSALELIETLPRWNRGACLFSATGGERPVTGFTKAKQRLDRAIAALRAEERAGEGTLPEEQDQLPRWTFHDLRRTVRTRLSALGVPDVVAELVIGHRQQGVRAIYDLHRYDREKREALERWEASLRAILDPPPDNVVPLRQAEQ